jgi:molecular chaperone GrpE
MNEPNQTENHTESDDASDEVSTEQLERDQDNAFQALQAEIEDLRNKTLYAQAETQNVRRRLEKEKQDAAAYAATGFARDILSVSDNLTRALASISAELRDDERLRPLITGLEMTGKELENVFQRNGISKIEAMQAGYMIRDRLLRPALVGVAKAPAAGKVDLEA